MQRQKNYETYTDTVPKNEVAADIESISNKMVEQRKSCIQKRKQIDELIAKQKKLEKKLEGEEDALVQIHQKYVDIIQVQLQGKKKQKLDYELKLQRKMHTIERMQEKYSQLEQELTPFIKTVQAQIDKLATMLMRTRCEQLQAATSPNIVDAIASAELPSMSSSGSESIRADGEYSPLSAESVSCNKGH